MRLVALTVAGLLGSVLLAAPVTASEDVEAVQIGMASWYGDELAGRPTASGEIFRPDRLTAAHRTLPLGTEVEVENLANGRTVVVTINDRGPFTGGRVIDLSERAARQLKMVDQGVARVRIVSDPR